MQQLWSIPQRTGTILLRQSCAFAIQSESAMVKISKYLGPALHLLPSCTLNGQGVDGSKNCKRFSVFCRTPSSCPLLELQCGFQVAHVMPLRPGFIICGLHVTLNEKCVINTETRVSVIIINLCDRLSSKTQWPGLFSP